MNEHSTGYTVGSALELARALKHGPLPAPTDPTPRPQEAVEIISQERRTCGFNWITGEVAEAVVRAYVEGTQATGNTACPYADWSDEYRAWREGQAAQK